MLSARPAKPVEAQRTHAKRRQHAQRGLSLIEAALGLALALLIMVSMSMMSQRAANDMRAQAAADSLRDFNRFVVLYLMAHRDAILKASGTGEDAEAYCVLNADIETGEGEVAVDTTRKTCSIDVSWLKHKRIVPAHYPDMNPYRQRWVAIYRNVFDDYDNDPDTPDISQGDIELLIVGVGATSITPTIDELMLGASLVGGHGGVMPSRTTGACQGDDPATREACGMTSGWKVRLNDFMVLDE